MLEITSPDPPGIVLALSFLFGLLLGSFLNVVIQRLPKQLSYYWAQECRDLLAMEQTGPGPPGLVRPRSHCPHCGHPIRPQHNIPVLSYLWLRGRCADCGASISLRYPLVELLTALVTLAVAWRFGLTTAGFAALILSYGLVALFFIDLDHQILPDVITLPGLWLGLACNGFGLFTDLYSAVWGVLAGYLSLWLVYHGFRLVTGKHGMGHGDFKLIAMLGAWMGWQALPLVILMASFVGSLMGIGLILTRITSRDTPIPFGPFLATAGWITLMWGHDLASRFLPFLVPA